MSYFADYFGVYFPGAFFADGEGGASGDLSATIGGAATMNAMVSAAEEEPVRRLAGGPWIRADSRPQQVEIAAPFGAGAAEIMYSASGAGVAGVAGDGHAHVSVTAEGRGIGLDLDEMDGRDAAGLFAAGAIDLDSERATFGRLKHAINSRSGSQRSGVPPSQGEVIQ